MSWEETCPMPVKGPAPDGDERMKFIGLYLQHEWPMAALCREFGISRKTGYKLVRRYIELDLEGLKDKSRTPHRHPNAVSAAIERAVVTTRSAHPTWGPKKLRACRSLPDPALTELQRQDSTIRWPAASTIGDTLKRHGLVVPRRRSRKTMVYREPFIGCDAPNAVWSADLKGWFRTGDGVRCDPLTITDNHPAAAGPDG